jgi:hypothetical protein
MFHNSFIGKHDHIGNELRCGDECLVLHTDWPSKTSDDSRSLEQYMDDISFPATIQYNEEYCCFEFLGNGGHTSSINCGPHGRIVKLKAANI